MNTRKLRAIPLLVSALLGGMAIAFTSSITQARPPNVDAITTVERPPVSEVNQTTEKLVMFLCFTITAKDAKASEAIGEDATSAILLLWNPSTVTDEPIIAKVFSMKIGGNREHAPPVTLASACITMKSLGAFALNDQLKIRCCSGEYRSGVSIFFGSGSPVRAG